MKTILPNAIANNEFSERLANKIIRDRLEKNYYRTFFASAKNDSPQNTADKVLLYSGISSMYLTPLEILFYHFLKEKGFAVDYLVYDESIIYNEVTTQERVQQEGVNFIKRSVAKGHSLLHAAGVDFQTISLDPKVNEICNALKHATLEEIFSFKYDEYDIGDIVKGVMYRYYKSINMGTDAAVIAKHFLATTLSNYFEIKRRCESTDYHTVMFSHGIYCTWQIVVDYCNRNNINFVCYDRAKTKGRINLNRQQPSPVWDISNAWSRLKDYRLSQDEELKVDSYLRERESQQGDVFVFNYSEKTENLAELKNKLGIQPHSKVITIFTNLIWDAANVSRDIAFESPLDCIEKTINRYANRNDAHILIRPHPAEKVIGTNERYGELVKEIFNQKLPSNVTIIEPEMNINSFSVLDVSDIGVIHTSTVGLEMAIAGKPVILISDTHYRGKGFTFDATSTSQYFETLDTLLQSEINRNKEIELARKYFYFMMFEYQHISPLTHTKLGAFNGYVKNNFASLYSSPPLEFSRIIDAISEKKLDFVFR